MDPGIQILYNTGVAGVMLVMVWRLMVTKDRKSYATLQQAHKEHEDDLKNFHAASVETIQEVTAALVSKNFSDEKMALAVDKLTEQLRQLKDVIKEIKNG